MMDIKDDKKLINECIEQLKTHRSINVTHFLTSKGYSTQYSNSDEFISSIRRIRHSILENQKYSESSTKSRNGDYRIRFNPGYRMLQIQKWSIIATLLFSMAAITIQVVNLRLTISSQNSQKELQEKVKEIQEQVQYLKPITQPINQSVVPNFGKHTEDSAK